MTIPLPVRAVLITLALSFTAAAQAPADITGRWVGSIDTDQGQMEIALDITHADGKFAGELTSGHGGWPVTSVTSKDGEWTVAFGKPDDGGYIKGKIAEGRFRGEWKTHMATGTFDLQRARRR